MRWTRPIRLVVAAWLVAVVHGTPAHAAPDESCTYGDARASLETFPLTFDGVPPLCAFRLFQDRPWTFTAEEFFLGGVVVRRPDSEEAARPAAVAAVESYDFRVWIAPSTNGVTGPLVEHTVERTAIKTATYDPLETSAGASTRRAARAVRRTTSRTSP